MLTFEVKKFISGWLMPLPFSVLLLMIGCCCLWWQRERIGRWMVTAGLLFLLASSSTSVLDHLLFGLERSYPVWREHDAHLTYVVVMGAGNSDSQILPLTDRPDSAAVYRLLEGIAVYRANPGSKLVLSGLGSHRLPHAELMARVAFSIGVPEGDVITQDVSMDTEQEVSLLASIVRDKSFAVVTSAYHMPRTIELFNAVGLHPLAVPTHFSNQMNAVPDWFELYVPDPKALDRAELFLHESLGRLWLRTKRLFS